MIGQQARAGFEQLFTTALRSRLVRGADDACAIEPAAPALSDRARGIGGGSSVVLTISSIGFRLLFILEIDDGAAIRAYYAPHGDEDAFRAAFAEVANLCCGLLSQGLVDYFPDLGMSTPYFLGSGCLAHLDSLRPDHVFRQAVTIADSVRLCATMCVCAHTDIDFTVVASATEVSAGELELF